MGLIIKVSLLKLLSYLTKLVYFLNLANTKTASCGDILRYQGEMWCKEPAAHLYLKLHEQPLPPQN